ncbi:MAG: hypothetical protein ACI4AQ_10035 [Lachnospiraceae bacterium]
MSGDDVLLGGRAMYKKVFYVILLMLVLGLLVSRYKYRMFSDEILELKQYNGIRDVSKLDLL